MDTFQAIWDEYVKNHKAALEAVAAKYQAMGFDSHSFVKYFNAEAQIREKLRFAELLGLTRSRDKFCLDIGCGMGWMSYVAKALGHKIVLADLPLSFGVSIEAYNAGINALGMGIRTFDMVVRRQTPAQFPYLSEREVKEGYEHKYDIITATGTCFEKKWTADDWAFFLADLIDNHLNPGGKIFLQLNITPGGYEAIKHFNFAALPKIKTAEWVEEQAVVITTQNTSSFPAGVCPVCLATSFENGGHFPGCVLAKKGAE